MVNTLAGRVADRYYTNGSHSILARIFGSGLARLAVVGLAASVALLVVVLSVMNGFDRELRERILQFVPHVELYYRGNTAGAGDYQQLREEPTVRQLTPFARSPGLLYVGGQSRAVELLGLNPQELPRGWGSVLTDRDWLMGDGIVISQAHAEQLGVAVGDQLLVLLGDGGAKAAALQPRTIVSVYSTHTELDQVVALLGAASLAATGAANSGWQIQLSDPLQSRSWIAQVYPQLSLVAQLRDWRTSHGNLYQAIQLSRQLVVLLILLTVAIAAFNVVAMLVMSVERRRRDIAILQTLGLSQRELVVLFARLAARIGCSGVLLGIIFGLMLCAALPALFEQLQVWWGEALLSTEVYPIDYLPVDIRWQDFLVIAGMALGLTALAAVYPARRASRVLPALELRCE